MAAQQTSRRPYLVRAMHEWMTDNGQTPHLVVDAGVAGTEVPKAFVRDGRITLNVGWQATQGLKLGNEWIEFKARFGGVSRAIQVPVDHVIAIYARENGQGMAFPMPSEGQTESLAPPQGNEVGTGRMGGLRLASDERSTEGGLSSEESSPDKPTEPSPPSGPRPSLKRIK